jgi:Tfp pilus assembly protein PilN
LISIPALLEWIESTELSTAIREGALPYPIIGGIHLLGIALFGGMVLVSDLRLLGWGMRRYSVSDIVQQLQTWKRAGFIVVASSGLLLAWAEPIKLYRSPAFWCKMALLVLVGVHALVFRGRVYGNTACLDGAATIEAKLAASISLILWAGLIVSGRLIAYDA